MRISNSVKQRFERMYQLGKKPWSRSKVPTLVNKLIEIAKKDTAIPKLLDIGCGDGWLSYYLAEHGFEVWGIDSSQTAINEAKKESSKELTNLLHFRCADVLDFPYDSSSFNVVFDRGLLHHQPEEEWPRYLEGVKKVLKPNGILYLEVFGDKSRKYGFSPKKSKKYSHSRKDKQTGLVSYDHFFNERLIKEIFESSFQIIEFYEEENQSKNGSQMIQVIMKRN